MLSLARLAASDRTGFSGVVSSSTSSQRMAGSTSSPRISQMLCRTQQAPSTTGRSCSLTSVRFCRQAQRALSLAKASTATRRRSATFSLKACCVHVRLGCV
ncbi:hypothetical protein U9M48_018656 [Paspalum notatum var. saurae]|uniref:Uncharacterized protein n=1 Tax=Paspalum notatum var. saurae TaxID=547442 RepID=A0AAQ3WPW8_PASNO